MTAAHAGVMRQVENLKNGLPPRYGAGHQMDWQLHIEGALGEMALAKHLGLYWPGKGERGQPDLVHSGWVVEVRLAKRDDYDLRLHPHDKDHARYWLMTGINGSYSVRGWILGADGKKSEFWGDKWNTGRPAYWVPQSELHEP